MKRINTSLLCMFFMLSVVNAQDITVFNFDGITPTFSNGGWGDTFASNANPLSDALNSSANVGKLTLFNAWSNGNSTTVDIDPRVYSSFEVSIYSPNSTTGKVQIQLKDASGNQLDWYEQAITTSTGWIIFTRNLSFKSKIASVVVYWNHGTDPTSTSADIVYLDNLVFKKAISSTINLYSQRFGDWNTYAYGDAALFSLWGAGATVSGKAIIDWSNCNTGDAPADGTALKVTTAMVGANGLTLSDIDVAGFKDLKIKFGFGHKQYWENPGIPTNRPKISYNIDGGSWVILTDADVTSGTWPTVDGNMNSISYSVGATGSKISILIEGGSIDYFMDNLNINGTIHYQFTGSTSSDPTISSNWSGGYMPESTSDFTISGGNLEINQNSTYNIITINPTAKLTLNDAKTLSVTNLLLKSDATGTATFVDMNTTPLPISATVQQYLPATNRNWYLSSPIASATNGNLNAGLRVDEFNEQTGLWPTISSGTLTPGKGYVQVAAPVGSTATVSFSSTLNSGDVPVTLTNTSGKGNGYNLVGNPYPSYLNWQLVNSGNAAANMPTGTMWYRTINYNGKSAWTPNFTYSIDDIVYNGTRFYKVITAGTSAASGGPSGTGLTIMDNSVEWAYQGSIYIFATVNADGEVNPSTVSNLVPPMQAFWVKSTGGTLTFKNTMRSHNTDLVSNMLKAPKSAASEKPLVRLSVTNGVSTDEAVIYVSTYASNDFDRYDAPKYFNTASYNQPEIYTQVGTEKLAINALNELSEGTEISLGFVTAKDNNFNIKATELKNLASNMHLILKDKLLNNTEFDLTNGQAYNFSSSAVIDADRFSLILRAPGMTTATDKTNKLNAQVFVNINNQIVIAASEVYDFTVYNSVGQKINSGLTATNHTIVRGQSAGMYVVKLSKKDQNYCSKVIIK